MASISEDALNFKQLMGVVRLRTVLRGAGATECDSVVASYTFTTPDEEPQAR